MKSNTLLKRSHRVSRKQLVVGIMTVTLMALVPAFALGTVMTGSFSGDSQTSAENQWVFFRIVLAALEQEVVAPQESPSQQSSTSLAMEPGDQSPLQLAAIAVPASAQTPVANGASAQAPLLSASVVSQALAVSGNTLLARQPAQAPPAPAVATFQQIVTKAPVNCSSVTVFHWGPPF
jgi:hypothetical protein